MRKSELKAAIKAIKEELNIDAQFKITANAAGHWEDIYVRRGPDDNPELVANAAEDSTDGGWPIYVHRSGLLSTCRCAEELVQAAVELLKITEQWQTQQLRVVDVHTVKRSWGYPPRIYYFNRPISDEEIIEWGEKFRLTPFICPCGMWKRWADDAVWVDESTD